MASYQDLESRIGVLERQLEFVMKTFSVTKETRSRLAPEQVYRETFSLLDLYRQTINNNLSLLSAEEARAQGIGVDPTPSEA